MENKQATLEEVYNKLLFLERLLKAKGIITEKGEFEVEDDEGELTEEFKAELKKRRKSKNYISHEEVKKRVFSKK